MYGYVYLTTNVITNKKYIGQHSSSTFTEDYKGSGRYLCNAINKYGKENFKVELLEWCDTQEELNEREIYWINKYNAVESNEFYNLAKGGEGIKKGSKLSKETRKRISNGHKGLKFSKEHKQNISKALSGTNHYLFENGDKLTETQKKGLEYGRHLPASPKQKQQLAEYRKNVVVSDETKQKLSDNAKGRKYITKDGENKLVYPDEIQNYILEGWKLGRYTPWKYNK